MVVRGALDHVHWHCSALDEGVFHKNMEDGWHAAVKEGSFNVFVED